jgi:hypothetical protein
VKGAFTQISAEISGQREATDPSGIVVVTNPPSREDPAKRIYCDSSCVDIAVVVEACDYLPVASERLVSGPV